MNNELLIGSMIQEQKCYIEVDVNVELPKESGRYMAYVSEINDLGVSHFYWNCCFDVDSKVWSDKFISYQVTNWLKPIENRYVLTEEELYELIRPLDLLVQLKEYKEAFGKDEYYLKIQPKTWERARKLIQEYNEHLQSLNPKIK